jgi:hypothetical protein
MTTGDLVRNEIFSKTADESPALIEEIDQRSWQPFYKKFKSDREGSLFDSYFFPDGLIQDQYLRKSEVDAKLREKWRDTKDPELIVKVLAECQDAFLDVACGTNLQRHKKDVHQAFRLLYESGAPGSTYPFTMQLSNAIKNGLVQEGDGIEVLDLIASFLVRRPICGHEPTGLHAVFKSGRRWINRAATDNG